MTLKEQIAWCKGQIKKGYEVIALRSILARLQSLEKVSETPAIYQQCLHEYAEFLRGRNIPLIMDARQGKALKQIIAKLYAASVDKSDDGIFASWKFILRNWQRTGDFIGRQIKLSDIDRNLLEILDKIRNGANKKQAHINEAERFRNELTK
ncbi:hypothetical protein [Pedobacter sp.]|uniref:hypothetical protein n=1 Tax=Pedobacter sp. TaxID=1411316 RepID=UPI00396CCE38